MLVQANRGLVKDVQNHLETRANLCHWAQALNTIDVWLCVCRGCRLPRAVHLDRALESRSAHFY